MSKPFFVKLQNRGLLQIEGDDRVAFLQGLISNDMKLLETQPALYACLLTAQGKFLHDFFVIKGDGVLLIDCEGGDRAQDLYKRLLMYRLRSKVQISIEEHNDVYAVIGQEIAGGYADPRHEALGYRVFEKPADTEEQDFAAWDELRISLCVPDGSRDMEIEKSTLLECHIDKLNGISYAKGCYVGQELTARMHHRGLAKKHLYAVKGDLPDAGADIIADGKLLGQMRSSCGDIGLALVKDDLAGQLPAAGLTSI